MKVLIIALVVLFAIPLLVGVYTDLIIYVRNKFKK